MIKKYSLFEKLGYNEEISKLTDYVWNLYKKGYRIIDLKEYSKNNMSIEIDKLYIEDYKDINDDSRMKIYFNDLFYKKYKSVKILVNKSNRPFIPSMEHELKHLYDFIKNGGEYLKVKDKSKIGYFGLFPNIDKIDKIDIFLKIIYIMEMNEIEAYFHSDIRNYNTNKKKFKNINNYIRYSRLRINYLFLKNNNIKDIISKMKYEDKILIIELYNKIKDEIKLEYKYKFYIFRDKIKEEIKNILFRKEEKKYTKEEIDCFFNKLIKDFERKKKIYLKYIGKLWSYFN